MGVILVITPIFFVFLTKCLEKNLIYDKIK